MSLPDDPVEPVRDSTLCPGDERPGDERLGDEPATEVAGSERSPRVRRAMSRRSRSLLSWLWVLTIAVLLSLAMRTFLVAAFFIPSESMEPTLQIGDRLLVSKLSYRIGEPSPGDVVVFGAPDRLRNPKTAELVKRVVAIGNQTVEAAGGRLIVDGTPVREEYLSPGVRTHDFGPFDVPKGYVFVLGDNRISSQDSRYFGPVHESKIVGRAFARFWPPNRIGGL